MFYREVGQFKSTYAADMAVFPIRQDRIGILVLLAIAVVVLPLSIPILIFGVAASNAALSEQASFGTPFSILCALSLFTLVIGPFAAAASLRQGLD